MTKGLVYYSDCRGDPTILEAVRSQLLRACGGLPLVAVTLAPVPTFVQNIVLSLERSRLSMFKQILTGLETLETDVAFLCEHDVLYHPSHFIFTPERPDRYYYNRHWYRVDAKTGRTVTYLAKQVSQLCAFRETLVAHYRKRVALVEADGYDHNLGYEPGLHARPRKTDDFPHEFFQSDGPNIDIRHGCNLTASRWDPSQFHDKSTCTEWQERDDVPGWGVTKGRFDAFLHEVVA